MRTLFFAASLLACALCGFSCATVGADASLSATVADGVNIKNLRTYKWMPDAGDSINNLSIFDNQILRNRMHRAIDQEMKLRGIRADAGAANPDMLLQLVVQGKGGMAVTTRTTNNGTYPSNRYPYGTGNTTTTSTPDFVQHRIVILNGYDLNRNLLWSLSVSRDYKNAEALQKNIEKDMAAMMSRYPTAAP